MKILILSEKLYPHGSGAQLATHLYVKLLTESGFSVVVVTNRFSDEPEISKSKNLMVYRLPLFKNAKSIKYFSLRRFDLLLSKFIKRLISWADVVYIPHSWYSAIPLVKAYGKPVVAHLHANIPICPIGAFYDLSKDNICNRRNNYACSLRCIIAYEKSHGRNYIETLASAALNLLGPCNIGRLIALSDAVICVSEAQRNLIITRAPFLRQKSHVIHNLLPELSHLDIETNDFGYFGGPSPLKGFHVVTRALAHMTSRKVKVHATKFPSKFNVGSANSLSRLGFLLYAKLSPERYERVYRRICGVIVPSIWPEPLPYVISEALLKGRVVIASCIGGIPEQVSGCPGVFLFQSGDHERLAEIIKFVSSLDRQTLLDLGVKSREAILRKFDNKRILQDFVNVLANFVHK